MREFSAIPPPPETVVLVDDNDRDLDTCEKLVAHERGLLHRAFSVVVWDGLGRQLLQKRAAAKYHSGGLWTNTCCGHPRPGEPVAAAAARRLKEELGFSAPLEWLGIVTYRADVGRGLIEHEIVHVFRARYDGPVTPDAGEVEAFQWCDLEQIERDVVAAPERFSAWFVRYVAEAWPLASMPPDDDAASQASRNRRPRDASSRYAAAPRLRSQSW